MALDADAQRGPATDPIAQFLEDETRRGSWPGAVWLVSERGRAVSSGAVGSRALVPVREAASVDTIYDLASLTKPLATAALLAILDGEGALELEAPASRFLPGLFCAMNWRPTLFDLAVHRSGLPGWRPLWSGAGTPRDLVESALRLPAEYPCGGKVVYSDPGYILLGEILRTVTGKTIGTLFEERIARPLGLGSTRFRPPAALAPRIAPTERGNEHERRLAEDFPGIVAGTALRTGIIRGEVHDGNAMALGGEAGHAGLFGTADEIARLAREVLGGEAAIAGLFGTRALALFRENATPGLEEGRTLGWKRAVRGAREAEGVLADTAFGHAGFTGTSVWLEPGRDRIYVLLTNRVHPEVKPTDMTALRRRFHEIASVLA
jgi:CubicO group peptidase (beta-lactamase class C family)